MSIFQIGFNLLAWPDPISLQIEKGGPVTDPEITRYIMSMEEAAQLILQAGAMGSGGEIFLLKMGQPIKIANLAVDLIRLMGYEPEADIEIDCTGLRPQRSIVWSVRRSCRR